MVLVRQPTSSADGDTVSAERNETGTHRETQHRRQWRGGATLYHTRQWQRQRNTDREEHKQMRTQTDAHRDAHINEHIYIQRRHIQIKCRNTRGYTLAQIHTDTYNQSVRPSVHPSVMDTDVHPSVTDVRTSRTSVRQSINQFLQWPE